MNTHSSANRVCEFRPGQFISGRWHGRTYQVMKLLGEGAVGKVYLVKRNNVLFALKTAGQASSVSSEVHVLRRVSQVRGVSLGPSFIDMDDAETPHGMITFYVMEYIHGQEFLPFVKARGPEWPGLFTVQLLGELHLLHKAGWVFGDLKPENLIVTSAPYKVRWVDPGGITKEGRSIKEYTEFFDRGYWGAGDRKADYAYDLFAAAMVLVNSYCPSRFKNINQRGPEVIMTYTRQNPELSFYVPVIEKAVKQQYKDAEHMKRHLLETIKKKQNKPLPSRVYKKQRTNAAVTVAKPAVRKREPEVKGLPETIIFSSFLLFIYVLYLTG